ncbi:L-2-hydroxyglutarate oxidase [Paenirhodobacter populi]|uniref:L-2-hydroxyglutarate oxidase n=1 Tax=Paenirhodobacter populi TaxID=2306993 RepID=UPI000FE2D1AF|nr:L-2-hydroxyglutarate oxidase [Sinirhodobacter populi]RWR04967.1 L-2-hydroxyglutarate oxidase [Sinirhodobacter populi]
MDYQYCVVGGGIIGLATAAELAARDPAARILLIEKEAGFGRHQTGHNSGVIHAGIYYAPGSLKARLCREGAEATKAFATARGIPFEVCGKLLVATNPVEMERMEALKGRARENGIAFEEIGAARLREIEPNIAGLGAILVTATGIIDYRQICEALAGDLKAGGTRLLTGARVTAIAEDGEGVTVTTDTGERIRAGRLVACAGLQSDRLARIAGLAATHQIVPFRGEYYTLPAAKSQIVKHLIYPIPDPDLPFLGIHLTRMIDGRVTVGPNAVLGFDREGYPKGSVRLGDVAQMLTFGGFWKMARRNLRSGIDEFRNSLSRRGYLQQCRKYCPSLVLDDLGAPGAGIRAQAILADGTLVHDFLFLDSPRQLHVCNAPSPAATSAMPIAKMIVDRLEKQA